MKTFISFIKFMAIILYISLLYTWINTFIAGHYYVHAGFFSTTFIGLFPVWGGWLLYKFIKFVNSKHK